VANSEEEKIMLSGYKTYITAGLTVLGVVATVLEGQMTWQAAIGPISTAVLAAFLRNGVTTSASS